MKLTLDQQTGMENEIIVRFHEMDDEIRSLLETLALMERRIQVQSEREMRLLSPGEVLYLESIDGRTFVYTAADVYTAKLSLDQAAESFKGSGYFRCSKSMVLNLHALSSLKSGDNGRIVATLSNGERILVSRQYAKKLRDRLKGGMD